MKTVAFVPMKLNNERLPGKNTKAFDDGTPLFEHILRSLGQADGIDEVFVYCSDTRLMHQLPTGVHFLERDPILDRSDTPITDVLIAFANDIVADVYVLAHATAPFLSPETINRAVSDVQSGDFDSALTVAKVQEFFWIDGRPMNFDPLNIARTQDLTPMYSETTGLYVYRRDLLLEHHRRVGFSPSLIEVSKIEAIDINEPIDFSIANAVNSFSQERLSAGIGQ